MFYYSQMENDIYSATVQIQYVDGRTHVNLLQPNGQNLPTDLLGKILAGGLALAIRGSENEAEYMKEIIDYLHSEFINSDSFSDIEKRI